MTIVYKKASLNLELVKGRNIESVFQLSPFVATAVNAHFIFYSQMFELQSSFGYFWSFPGYFTGDKGDWNFSLLIILKKVIFRVLLICMFIFRRLRHSWRHLSNLLSLSNLMGTMLINAPSKFLLHFMCILIPYHYIGQKCNHNSILHIRSPYICIHVLHSLEKGLLWVLTSFDNFLFPLWNLAVWNSIVYIFKLSLMFTVILFCLGRCKKMVTASKRFTIHRSSNVLTVSLKRFTNFNGGKITKVHCIKVITKV